MLIIASLWHTQVLWISEEFVPFPMESVTSCIASQRHLHLLSNPTTMSAAAKPEPANASPMPAGVTDVNYRPLPGQLGHMTMVQVHALETLKKQLKAEGKFVEARMDDAALLRHVTVGHIFPGANHYYIDFFVHVNSR